MYNSNIFFRLKKKRRQKYRERYGSRTTIWQLFWEIISSSFVSAKNCAETTWQKQHFFSSQCSAVPSS